MRFFFVLNVDCFFAVNTEYMMKHQQRPLELGAS